VGFKIDSLAWPRYIPVCRRGALTRRLGDSTNLGGGIFMKSSFWLLLVFAFVIGAIVATPGTASAVASCTVGIDPCAGNTGNIGTDSCNGNQACNGNAGNIGDGSCIGDEACRDNSGTIRDSSCIGDEACQDNVGTIGDSSCIGTDACDPQTGPTVDKDDCKQGGWQRFNAPREFKNQGDCIQFVNKGK